MVVVGLLNFMMILCAGFRVLQQRLSQQKLTPFSSLTCDLGFSVGPFFISTPSFFYYSFFSDYYFFGP